MYNNYFLKHIINGDNMEIKDIMSKNLIVKDINTNIYEIAKTMKEYDIGFIPISKNNTIIGVLTDRDIVTKILANNDNKIDGYINNKIITININKSIDDIINLMGNKKIKRVLIENNNKIVGVVSLSDIIKYIDDQKIKNAISKIWEIDKNIDRKNVSINDFEL